MATRRSKSSPIKIHPSRRVCGLLAHGLREHDGGMHVDAGAQTHAALVLHAALANIGAPLCSLSALTKSAA